MCNDNICNTRDLQKPRTNFEICDFRKPPPPLNWFFFLRKKNLHLLYFFDWNAILHPNHQTNIALNCFLTSETMYSRINHEFPLFTNQFSNLHFFFVSWQFDSTLYILRLSFSFYLLFTSSTDQKSKTSYSNLSSKMAKSAMIKLNLECQTSLFPIWENISKSMTIIYRAIAILGKVSRYLILSQ